MSPVPLSKRNAVPLSSCVDGAEVRSAGPSGKGFGYCLNPCPVMILTRLYWEEKAGSTGTHYWGDMAAEVGCVASILGLHVVPSRGPLQSEGRSEDGYCRARPRGGRGRKTSG